MTTPTTAAAAEPATRAKKGCLAGVVGCAGAALGAAVLLALFLWIVPGFDARAVAKAVRPGMSAPEVLAVGERWLSAQAVGAAPSGEEVRVSLHWPRRIVLPSGQEVQVDGVLELGRALEAEMKKTGAPWTLTLGYVTITPRRLYITVDFGPDARVTGVREPRWGVLN